MRMGLALFMPLKHRLIDGEAPAVVDLMRRYEQAMAGEQRLSLHDLQVELQALPPPLAHARPVRVLWVWLLGELQQRARALAQMEDMVNTWRQELGSPTEPLARRWLVDGLSYQGILYADDGRLDQSSRCFTEARGHLRSLMPASLRPRMLSLSPGEAARLASLDASGFSALLADALAYQDAVGEPDGAARVANALGHLYLRLGEPFNARFWLERSVELLQQAPNDFQLAYGLDSLGLCYQQLGLTSDARTALDEALLLATRIAAPWVQASVLAGLAALYRDEEQFRAALELYEKAQALEEHLRSGAGLARVQIGRSTLYRRSGQFALALEAAAEAQTLIRAQGSPLLRLSADLQAHAAAAMLGRSEALGALEATVEQLAHHTYRREEALGRWYLAHAAYRADRGSLAATHLGAALSLSVQFRHLHLLALELPVTADLLRLALAEGLSPEGVAGLVQRARPTGLAALLRQVPSAAPLLAAAGRLGEARVLRIQLLGLFRVMRAGQEIDLSAARSQKAVSLLKFLVGNRGRSVTREQIVDTIWPDADPAAADRSFEVTLSTLRKVLDGPGETPVILRRGRGYLLNPEIPLEVDVDRFRHHLERGNWWRERGQSGPAVAEWRAAEGCYGGDLLAEDPYEDWAISERERLREQYLDLVLQLGEIALREGRCAEAAERANRVLAADPIRESGYRLLMRAHAQMGDRAVALRDYQRCSRVLERELGEEPMPETSELAAQIRAGLSRRI